jgi:hypothetical protein
VRKTSLLFIALAFVVTASVALLIRNSQANKTAQDARIHSENELRAMAIAEGRKRARLAALPKVVHETPSLHITNMEVIREETFDLLRITFRNYSEKAINSFTICHDIQENGWTGETFHAPPGKILIEPHSEISKTIPAEVFNPRKPLTVCALMFVDETDEGLPDMRTDIKESYAQRKQAAQKEKP